MKVVSDASPLIFLAKCNLLVDVVNSFELFITPTVEKEILNDKYDEVVQIRQALSKVQVKIPITLKHFATLDAGEEESINLAFETKALLFIDEQKGRVIARSLGLKTMGTLGVINFLLKDKKISKKKVFTSIEILKQSNYYIHPAMLDAFVEQIKKY